ncbi:MAG: NAD(P)-dependent oxidoreductase [Acidobacteriota bacterium]
MSPFPVVVTEAEYQRAERTYLDESRVRVVIAPAAEAPLAAAIREAGARHAIVGGKPYVGPLYAALPRGGVLARFGVGHDGIDKAAATAAGVLCTNTPSVLDQSVAEFTMALLTGAARWVPAMDAAMHGGSWTQREGIELSGKTLVVVGCGRIGRAVARIAAKGFSMRVVGLARSASQEASAGDADFVEITTDVVRAFGMADFVTLHMPSAPENRHYINAKTLALLPRHAWLINTARGAVLDELALYDALASRRLAGAALDVFDREPYEPATAGADLRTLPNVVLAPHVGSHTAEANHRMASRALQNVVRGEAKDYTGLDLLNPDVLRALAG